MSGAKNAATGVGKEASGLIKDGAQTDTTNTSKKAEADAGSTTRRAQLDSDIRAREQRTGATGKVSDGDIESKVRSKLEANLQKRTLTVTAKQGIVTLQGKVADQAELDKAVTLANEINGVKAVHSELTKGAV
jgi:osmotically-inducible protein OsmY